MGKVSSDTVLCHSFPTQPHENIDGKSLGIHLAMDILLVLAGVYFLILKKKIFWTTVVMPQGKLQPMLLVPIPQKGPPLHTGYCASIPAPDSVSGEATDGPSPWNPATRLGEPDGVPGY